MDSGTAQAKKGLDESTHSLHQLVEDLESAYVERRIVPAPTSRDSAFSVADAYVVEAELARRRQAQGHQPVGLKVGYANKAMWRALKLETLAWANLYDNTVHLTKGNDASLSIAAMTAPKIEPEIVFKVKAPVPGADPAAILAGVEWIALGFEIIDCVYPNWQFQPPDFIAAYGLHAALVVGEPQPVTPESIPELIAQLPTFKLRLSRNGGLVEEGSGKNSLRSPVLCLGEVARVAPLKSGDLVSSGTLTNSMPMAAGEVWQAEVEGLELPSLRLKVN